MKRSQAKCAPASRPGPVAAVAAAWSLLAVVLAVPAARAELTVRESFPISASAYSAGELKNKTSDSTGFDTSRRWANHNTTVVVVHPSGLSLPDGWGAAKYPSGGGSIGYNDSRSPATTDSYRGLSRELAESGKLGAGTHYVRALLNQGAGVGTVTPTAGMARGIGFRAEAMGDYGRTAGNTLLDTGLWFAFEKAESTEAEVKTSVVLRFGGGKAVLVSDAEFEEGTTYLCVAEVVVSDDGEDTARAFAVPVGDYTANAEELLDAAETLKAEVASSDAPLGHLTITGPFQTKGNLVSFDEIAVGSELSDVVPAGSFDFSVSGSVEVVGTVAKYSAKVVTNGIENIQSVSVTVKRGTGATSLNNKSVMVDNGDGSFAKDVSPLNYGTTYYYAFDATVTFADGTVREAGSITSSFGTFVKDVMFVKSGNAGTAPYSSPETAAPTIADAFAIAGDGATVKIADGEYTIAERIVLGAGTTVESVSGDPSKVVISLPEGATPSATTRFFNLNDGATLAGVTLSGGHVINGNGGNVFMRGGLLTNCVLRGGTCTWTTPASGESSGGNVYAQAGRIVDCTISGGRVAGGYENHSSVGRAAGFYGADVANGTGQVQNCLFVDNGDGGDGSANWVAFLQDNWVMENCTIVSSSLGRMADENGETKAAAVRLNKSSAKLLNCAIAGVVDATGAAVGVYMNPANVSYCAFDIAESDAPEGLGEGCVFSTAGKMFFGYGSGDFRPGDALRNKGSQTIASANLPAFDLSGKRERVIGPELDIGCYEYTPAATVFLLR